MTRRTAALRARARALRLKNLYGITPEQYNKMLRRQYKRCAICERPPKPGKHLHVDHDHKTGRVRGLLDWWCNHKFLGRGRESAEMHARAAAYLASEFDGRFA